jgi:hypothetical protein
LGWIGQEARFFQALVAVGASLVGLIAGGYAGYALWCREG